MNVVERRKVMCSVAFNLIAVTCVLWSLYVLIEKTREEVKAGKLRMSKFLLLKKNENLLFRMAFLDEIDCCCYRFYWRNGERIIRNKK
jgi:hypothetical protein